MSEDNSVNRRRLLRRAGTVATALGAAGVASAVAASPAAAAPGDSIVQGDNDAGTTATSITSSAASTLTLANSATSGAPLTLPPRALPTGAAADGSVFFGEDQALYYSWAGGNLAALYDSSWVPVTMPLSPFRIVDTATTDGRELCSAFALESAGRIKPRGLNTGVDMVVDLSWLFDPETNLDGCALQMNLTVLSLLPSYTAVWDSGNWPGTSSINSPANMQAISNFVQAAVGPDATLRFKVLKPTRIIVDVVGVIATSGNFAQTQQAQALAAKTKARLPRR